MRLAWLIDLHLNFLRPKAREACLASILPKRATG